jgi:hypothetical protein
MGNVLPGFDFIPAATVTTATVTGRAISLEGAHRFSVHLVVTSSDAAGSLAVQVSNDESNWVGLTFEDGSTSITVSGNTNALRDCLTHARFARAVYTRTGGVNGTIQAIGCRKAPAGR